MNTSQTALTATESNSIPKFDTQEQEDAYWREQEERGRAVFFFMLCGATVESLAMVESEAPAFWAFVWDTTGPILLRKFCVMLLQFPLCPDSIASASQKKWADLEHYERQFICRVSPSLAMRTRKRLALVKEQAA